MVYDGVALCFWITLWSMTRRGFGDAIAQSMSWIMAVDPRCDQTQSPFKCGHFGYQFVKFQGGGFGESWAPKILGYWVHVCVLQMIAILIPKYWKTKTIHLGDTPPKKIICPPKNDAWKTFFLLKQSLFRVNIRYIRSFSGVIRGFSIPKPVEDSVLAGQDCLCTVDGRNPAPVDMVNIPVFSW